MRVQIFVVLILISFLGSAQNKFYKCKLFFNNGNKVEGFAKLPINISMDDKIKYKKNLSDDKVIKLDGDRLEEIIYFTNDGKAMFFKNTKFYKSRLNSKSKVETKLFRKYWMVRSLTNDKLVVYTLSEGYKINKDGSFSSYSINRLGLGDYAIVYLVKRPEEEYPSMLSFKANGYVSNGDKFFKRTAMAYFKNDKPFYKRIKKGEYGLDTFDKLIRDYCDCNYQSNFNIHY